MKRWLVLSVLIGCSPAAPTEIVMSVGHDAAPVDAVAEAATDVAEATTPEADASDEPEADSEPVDAAQPEAEAAPPEAEAAPQCPAGMATPANKLPTGLSPYCYDVAPVTEAAFVAWLAEPDYETVWWCDGKPPAPDAGMGPVALVPWCAAATWCTDHGARLCSLSEWGHVCQPPTGDSGLEWLNELNVYNTTATAARWDTCGDYGPIDPKTTAAIRCCKEVQ